MWKGGYLLQVHEFWALLISSRFARLVQKAFRKVVKPGSHTIQYIIMCVSHGASTCCVPRFVIMLGLSLRISSTNLCSTIALPSDPAMLGISPSTVMIGVLSSHCWVKLMILASMVACSLFNSLFSVSSSCTLLPRSVSSLFLSLSNCAFLKFHQGKTW